MSLTVIEKNIVETLPQTQSMFVKAKFSLTIKSHTDFDLEVKITDLVQLILTESGVKDQKDVSVIKFISARLFDDLKTPKFNHLTFEEVKLSLHLGVRHEYGQYMGINVSTIHFWLKSFILDKNRELAIKEFNKKLDEQEHGKTNKLEKANPEGQKKIIEALKNIIKEVPAEQEVKKKLVNMGKQKSPRDMYIQKCFAEFDTLHNQRALRTKSGRYILYEEKPVDQVEYVELKLKEYDNSNLK